jgi:hypothetical protein
LAYTETKEQLGGVLVLEARDLNHAIQLISQHPGGEKPKMTRKREWVVGHE